LGNIFKEQGRLEEALRCYETAISVNGKCISARWNRSLALLQNGDYENGSREYESRLERTPSVSWQLRGIRWGKSNLRDRRICAYCEQGLGDAIQFVRYAALLRDLGAIVIVQAPSPLMSFFSTCAHNDHLVCESDPLPAYDCQIPFMSLPGLFQTRLETIPARVPYLHVDAEKVRHWRRRLVQDPGMKVGIAWQGNPHHQWDAHRSVPLSHFATLLTRKDVRLISL